MQMDQFHAQGFGSFFAVLFATTKWLMAISTCGFLAWYCVYPPCTQKLHGANWEHEWWVSEGFTHAKLNTRTHDLLPTPHGCAFNLLCQLFAGGSGAGKVGCSHLTL